MVKKVAIVGFAFRLPGASDDSLWDLLCEGKDLVTEVEDSRWVKEGYFHPDKSEPGSTYTFAAGSVGDVKGFDAAFFGISPREAEQMDPQQRLLLEMAWEAFESGGIRPSTVQGSRTAVFVGYSGTDYPYRRLDDLATIDASSMTGNTGSLIANRLSYFFDLHGPSMAVDTACSSALVAFHQAWQSIQANEVEQAIVGGISLHLHPFAFVGFSKASMLSPRGVCSVFDEAGDGYVRSEGGGIFLLKDLAHAQADGNRIFAVVAGSGANCDGKTQGVTVPSLDSQADLLREVYERAGIAPAEIDYLEAHGTGTAVGDPIETGSIGEVLGKARPVRTPLLIGSVKSNLGHLETASGVAGLVKVLYCLRHRQIPPTIHLTSPNPHIRFDEWNLRIATENTALPANKKLVIGVNSFGFGGANAHVVLEGYDDEPSVAVGEERSGPLVPLVISARSPAALHTLAKDYATHLSAHPEQTDYDIAYSALFHRELLEHRVVLCAPDRRALIESLAAYARGGKPANVVEDTVLGEASRPVFVYSGNGSQWAGMGQGLLERSERFRSVIEKVDRLFRQLGGDSIIDDLLARPGEDRFALTEVAQPALLAIQVGVTEMLRDWGASPVAVLGHSVGEVAAAWACGALSLEQAVRVIHERSALQGKTRGEGGMTAVGLSETDCRELLRDVGLVARVSIAGVNSPRGITLAGPTETLAALEQVLTEREIFHRRLPLDYAFHSSAMDPIRLPMLQALCELKPRNGSVPFYSTVTGELLRGELLDAEYWWRNVREPVLFKAALQALSTRGCNVFMEIGPHAVLRNYVSDCLRGQNIEGRIIGTLMRSEDHPDRVRQAFFQLFIAGSQPDLHRLFVRPGRFVDLPRYAWQHEPFWLTATPEGRDVINQRRVHPLLGFRSRLSDQAWENRLDVRLQPVYADHVVGNMMVFPAAGFVEMALAASNQWRPGDTHELEELEIRAPLLLEESSAKVVRFVLDESDGSFVIESRDRLSEDPWLGNAVGRLLGQPALSLTGDDLALPRRSFDWGSEQHYALSGRVGLSYGPAFQAVECVWREGATVIAKLRRPEPIRADLQHYYLHPSFLDAGFQLLVDHLAEKIDSIDSVAFVPVKVARLVTRCEGVEVTYVRSHLLRCGLRSAVANFDFYDRNKQLLAQVSGVRFRAVELRRSLLDHTGYLHYRLSPQPLLAKRQSADVPSFDEVLSICSTNMWHSTRADERTRYYKEVEPLLDVLCAAFAQRVLRRLVPRDQSFNAASLAAAGVVTGAQQPLLQRLIDILEEDGVLEPVAEAVRWTPDATLPNPEDVWISLLGDYPDYAAEILLVGRAGMHLNDALTGVLDVAKLSSRPCDGATFSQYVDGSPTLRRIDTMVADLIGDLQARLPLAGRLRILQFASCNSRVAARTLPQVDFSRCDYVVASARQVAIDAQEELLERFPAVDTFVVDFAQPPSEWGDFANGGFDLIVLGNAVAESPDAERMLNSLGILLRAGGVLVLVEQQASRWADIVFGLNPAWWSGPGEQDSSFGVVAPTDLCELLIAAGYEAPMLLRDNPEAPSGPYLALAQRAVGDTGRGSGYAGEDKVFVIFREAVGYTAELAEGLVNGLQEAGHQVISVVPGDRLVPTASGYQIDTGSSEQIDALVDTVHEASGRLDGFVFLFGLRPECSGTDLADELMAGQVRRCALVASVFQLCERYGLMPGCWLVTSGAAPAPLTGQARALGKDRRSLVDATFWGFGRTIINEYPDCGVRLVDLADPDQLELMVDGLLHEVLLSPDGEEEVVLTGEGRFVAHLCPFGHGGAQDTRYVGGPADKTVGLDFRFPGPLKNLQWLERNGSIPSADEVEIEVRAAGLNFRDVMYAMGLLSDEGVENGFAGATLGMELSGVVVGLGQDVRDLAAGDEVIAFAPASFATRAVTKAAAVVHKPNDWSFEAATTVPTAFFTAYYALHHLAGLQAGEKVLVHGAAGGVGIAAIQLAKHIGAEVFATAGSNEKRDFLRLLDADHVMDSRSLAFADEILELTGGAGIDVVLNSLAGEAINRNLRVLRPFGRYLELGKRDFYENTRIGLRPFRNNISYFGIDADQLMAERPELTRKLFSQLMELFYAKVLKPLPYRAFPAAEAVDAFRYMQQSKQIGKIVLTFDQLPKAQPSAADPAEGLRLPAQATYLVTGGLGGFGARTALWLAEKGARHLVLIGRRGLEAPEAEETLGRLREMGAVVRPFACDVTDKPALEGLLKVIRDEMPPLRGVVHAAMVIDDGLVCNLDAERIRRVFAPKVLGAMYLDELTRDLTLDFCVFYSSATTLFGNPGQASYVAANRFLEVLAEVRRAEGLPALCVSWGPIADVGYLARNLEVKESLQAHMGGAALNSQEALDILEQLLLNDRSGLGVLDLDWNTLRRFLPSADSPRFAEVARLAEEAAADAEDLEEIKRWVAELSTEELTELFIELLKKEVGEILRLAPERIDEHRSVYDLGMDSLMGMELVAAVETRFGVNLPIMALSEGPTIVKIVERIVRQLKAPGTAETAATGVRDQARFAAQQYADEVDEQLMEEVASRVQERPDDTRSRLIH